MFYVPGSLYQPLLEKFHLFIVVLHIYLENHVELCRITHDLLCVIGSTG